MTAASSTTRPTAGQRKPTSPTGSRQRRTSFSRAPFKVLKGFPYEKALRVSTTHRHDFLNAYVNDLANVIDMDSIRGAKVNMGVDPLGGAGVHYWARIAERYKLDLTVVNEARRSDFPFHDGGLGRPDPHGPILFVRHDEFDRTEGSFRHCLCL